MWSWSNQSVVLPRAWASRARCSVLGSPVPDSHRWICVGKTLLSSVDTARASCRMDILAAVRASRIRSEIMLFSNGHATYTPSQGGRQRGVSPDAATIPLVTYREIVRALVAAREGRGLSQAQVVRRLGVTKAALSAWEIGRNRADLDALADWAAAVGLQLAVNLVEPGARGEGERRLLDGAAELGLDDDRAALLLRLARVAGRMNSADSRRLAAYLGAVEEDLAATSRSA